MCLLSLMQLFDDALFSTLGSIERDWDHRLAYMMVDRAGN